eukprot:s1810_g9.t1
MCGWSLWMLRCGFSKMLFLTFPGSTVVWFEAIDLIYPQREDELNSRRVRCCCPRSGPKLPRLPKSSCLHSVSVAFDLEVCPPRSGTDIKGDSRNGHQLHEAIVKPDGVAAPKHQRSETNIMSLPQSKWACPTSCGRTLQAVESSSLPISFELLQTEGTGWPAFFRRPLESSQHWASWLPVTMRELVFTRGSLILLPSLSTERAWKARLPRSAQVDD